MIIHPSIPIAAASATVSTSSDPYAYYDAQSKGKGKGPPHPVVPEASSYGLIFVAIALAALGVSRYLNRHATR